MPGGQGLRDTPGLRESTARRVRRITVKYFADCSETALGKMRRKSRKEA